MGLGNALPKLNLNANVRLGCGSIGGTCPCRACHRKPEKFGCITGTVAHLLNFDTYIANTRQFLFMLTAGEANIALGSTNDELAGCTTSKQLHRSST